MSSSGSRTGGLSAGLQASAPGSAGARPGGGLGGQSGRLERVLDALAEAVTVTEADGRLVFANAAALARLGLASVDDGMALGAEMLLARFEITTEDGTPLRPDDLPDRRLLRGEATEPMLLRMVERSSGRLSWIVVKAAELVDLGERRLAVNVLEDVTETKERELRERFLAHATDTLSSSLDYEETLQAVAWLAVPDLADWCAVDMLEADELRQVAVAHANPDKIAFAKRFREAYPPRLDDRTGVGAVVRTGRAEFHPTVPDELLVETARDEEQLRLARELRVRSVIIAPIRGREQVIGAVTFVAAESAGAFDEDDLAFARDFAARAASAVENARLYRGRTFAAETLRQSLLPPALPRPAGWRVATRYLPAAEDDQIGGDFYDLFPSARGFSVIIGDVTGKGVRAAALTAMSRHSLRAAAALGLGPATALGLLNRLLLEQPELSLVTAIVARFAETSAGFEMILASAGHPLPLRHRSGKPAGEIGATGPLLGVLPDGRWPEATAAIEPGETLLFYTDGLTDTPGQRDRFGEQRLRELLPGCPVDAERLVQCIENALGAFQARRIGDDTAMLALERVP